MGSGGCWKGLWEGFQGLIPGGLEGLRSLRRCKEVLENLHLTKIMKRVLRFNGF